MIQLQGSADWLHVVQTRLSRVGMTLLVCCQYSMALATPLPGVMGIPGKGSTEGTEVKQDDREGERLLSSACCPRHQLCTPK